MIMLLSELEVGNEFELNGDSYIIIEPPLNTLPDYIVALNFTDYKLYYFHKSQELKN